MGELGAPSVTVVFQGEEMEIEPISPDEFNMIDKIYEKCLLKCTPFKFMTFEEWQKCMNKCLDEEFTRLGW